MKLITFIIAIAISFNFGGCGLYDHSHSTPCGRSYVDVDYEEYLVDNTNEFVGGMLCVGTNIEALYIITRNLDGNFTMKDVSYPQDQSNIDNCVIVPPGTYSLSFGGVVNYTTPPTDSEVTVRKGVKAKIYGFYGSS